MLGVIELPPEIMPLLAIFGPLLVVFVTLWTTPRAPDPELERKEGQGA